MRITINLFHRGYLNKAAEGKRMTVNDYFEDFCCKLVSDDEEIQRWKDRIKKITKKLNKEYYDSDSDVDNCLVVGSVGRTTAIHNVSDYDIIFELPSNKYTQYDHYSGNGQSALLQEVKNVIQSLHRTTNIKGDGQVVAISFTDGVIELVPAFRKPDDNFKHADSRNGGSWKTTKPLPEIQKVADLSNETNGHYINLCRIMRSWKNQIGFKFKGLLIDTMVKNFIDKDSQRKKVTYDKYYCTLVDLFEFLSNQDKECSYWNALGSNQQIYNTDNGKFISKAKKAYNKLKDVGEDESEAIAEMQKLLGKDFASNSSEEEPTNKEEWPEDKFSVDILYDIELDYTISQKGFRTKTMKDFMRNNYKLKSKKDLNFFIKKSNIPEEVRSQVKWYWKVRNVGSEAIKRKCERGNIFKGTSKHHEPTSFSGDHYVECYAVIDDVLVAKNRAKVPIDISKGQD